MDHQAPEVVSGPQYYDGLHPVALNRLPENLPEAVTPSYRSSTYEKPLPIPVEDPSSQLPEPYRFQGQGAKPATLHSQPSYTTIDEKELRAEEGAAPAPKQPFWRRKTILLAAIFGIVVLAAIVLGAVLGSRANSVKSQAAVASADTSNATSSSAPAASAITNQRIKSTKGAFNGTGLTCYQSTIKDFWGAVIYQDYTGALVETRFNYDKTNTALTFLNNKAVASDAANNTGLALAAYQSGSFWRFHMTYVNDKNELSDLWSNNNDLDKLWTQGNLSTHSFKSDTSSVPAMSMLWSDFWYTDSYGASGARLIAGGEDGQLHEYVLSTDNGTWSSVNYPISGSYAHGAIATNGGQAADGTPNTTLWSAAADGTLQVRTSIDGNVGETNTTNFPNGKWSSGADGSVKAAVNGSMVEWWGDVGYDVNPGWGKDLLGVIFETSDGTLSTLNLDETKAGASQFGATTGLRLSQYPVLHGTQFATCGGDDFTQIIFYQTEGDDISYLIIKENVVKNNGTLSLGS